jgi:ABC-type dipeptide/oligopeptide/nickel transport system permease subunit
VTTGNWWLFAAPGLAIFVTVLCVRLGSPWIEHMVGAKRTGSMN